MNSCLHYYCQEAGEMLKETQAMLQQCLNPCNTATRQVPIEALHRCKFHPMLNFTDQSIISYEIRSHIK